MSICRNIQANYVASCESREVMGGARESIYVIENLSDIVSTTFATTGELTAFTLSDDASLYKFTSTIKVNGMGAEALERENTSNAYTHSVQFTAFDENQTDVNAIQALSKAEQAVVFVVRNDNAKSVKVFGLDFGLKGSASMPLSVARTDSAATVVTLTGEQLNLPTYLKPATGTAIAYLEALLPE